MKEDENMANESFDEYKKVTAYHGETLPTVAMEKLAELISAIGEYERKGYGSESYFWALFEGCDLTKRVKELRQNVTDKISDISIICQALMHRYDIKPEEVDKCISEKMAEYTDEH